MARGRDKHDARVAAVAGLGRALSRRARNRCELCTDSTSLKVVELEPLREEPEPEWALMLCERCIAAVAGGRDAPDAAELRFLSETVWSEVLPAQVTAVRLGRRLADEGQAWARELLDGLYLDPETEALL